MSCTNVRTVSVYLQYTPPVAFQIRFCRSPLPWILRRKLRNWGGCTSTAHKNWLCFISKLKKNIFHWLINLVFHYSVALFAPNPCFIFLTLLGCFVVVLSSPVCTIYYAPNFLLDTDKITSFWSSLCQGAPCITHLSLPQRKLIIINNWVAWTG